MCTHIAQTVNAKKSPERIILFVNILSLISIQFDFGWCLAKMWWMAWFFFARVHYQWRPYFSLLCCWCCWFRSLFNEVGCKKVFSDFFARIFFFRRSRLCRWKKSTSVCFLTDWISFPIKKQMPIWWKQDLDVFSLLQIISLNQYFSVDFLDFSEIEIQAWRKPNGN